jgi:glycosyltransferase involved in cell wall biosynthesis
MRIALFHNVPSGGAKRAILEWAQRLNRNNIIDVYSLSTADHNFCDVRPLVHKHTVYPFRPRNLYRSPLGRFNQLQRWRNLNDLEMLNQQIASDINSHKYDILFANTCIFTFIPSLLQFTNIPSNYYLHEPFGRGLVRQINRPYQQKDPWRRLLDKYDPMIYLYQHKLENIQNRSSAFTHYYSANSHFTLECMQVEIREKTKICPCGVDLTSFKPLTGLNKDNYIVSVGEMSPRKGFDFIVESVAQIPKGKRPPLKLACNNVDTQEKNYIQNLAHQREVEVEIFTHLNTVELEQFYNRARLCVYAPIFEPFGIVPLEAMACGTPVVGIKEGGVQESIVDQKTGFLVERNPSKFADAILRLLDDSNLATTFGRNGREYVAQNWTWEQSANKLEAYLIQCANTL